MTAYRMTLVARRDVEALVRSLAREDVRAAERAVDELCATMEWLAGTPDVGQLRSDLVADELAADGAPRVRLWALRDWLLVYGEAAAAPGAVPEAEPGPDPATAPWAEPMPEPMPEDPTMGRAAGASPRPLATPQLVPPGQPVEPITVLRVLETQRPRWG